ncbi:HsdS Restriction endonuclease S subunits [Candidatus Nanopelagicaceae bacterium]
MRDGWKEIGLEELETSGVIKLGRGDVISKKDMEADPGPNPVYSSAENKNGMIGKYAKFMFDEELITWSVDGGGHIFYRPKHKFSVTNIGGWLRILDNKVFSYQFLTYALQRLHKQHSFDWQHKAHPSVIRKLYTRIPLPSLPEQKRIVDLISSVDSYIEALQQQLEGAKRSRNAVLHELLTAGGDDWVETTLGEVAEVIGGGTPSTTIGEYWDGDIVWLTPTEITSQDGKVVSDSIRKITDLGFKNSGAQMLPKDSVILTSRASVGFVALAGKELCTNQGFQSLIPKPSVLSKFLMFWIQLNRPEFESRSAGSTFKEISKSNVKSIKLELPPLAEQKRIVEIVNTIDEFISQTELTSSKAQKLRSGLLSDLLSGEHEIPVSYDKVIGAA